MRKFYTACTSLPLLLLVTACASISVSQSFDPDAEFSTLKSFGWMSGPATDPGGELTLKNIRYSVKTQLAGKGIIEGLSNPDFLIFIHGGREKKVDVQQSGYAYADRPYYYRAPRLGYGYGYYAPPTRIDYRTRTDTYEYEIGTLILDFVDPASKELIWRGTATAVVEDPVSQEKIDQAVSKLLEQFPPGDG